jgi:uncharacterized membrane protein (DUF485 family)
METHLFTEHQKVRQFWIWLVVIAISLLFIILFVLQIGFNVQLGNHPAPDWALWILLMLPVGLWYILMSFRLTTEIYSDRIRYILRPFMTNYHEISKDKILKIEVVKYEPMQEYTGWGYRFGIKRKNSRALTVSGNMGLSIEMKNGRHLLLGTGMPEELSRAVDGMNGSNGNISTYET